MWTSTRRSGAAHPMRSRQLGVAAALLACIGLAACTSAETPSPAAVADANSVAPMPENGDLEAGTYVITSFTVPFEVTVPDGWAAKDGWLLIKDFSDEQRVFLNFLNPSYVPTDACEWHGVLTDVGPSVEGFADALAAQGSTTTTAPTEITVGDYGGLEFGLSVEPGVEIDDCRSSQVCIHSETPNHCTRYYSSTARSETYRVLDLSGERAVMSVGEDAGVPAALTKEARAVFDSIVVAPDE